jgi:LPXTG-site transpeptidase (sortase) family protein
MFHYPYIATLRNGWHRCALLNRIVFFLMVLLLSACGSQSRALTPKPSPTVTQKQLPTMAVSPTVTVPMPTPTSTVALPLRLVIPRIGVNAPIENVGITANGDLATPKQDPWDGVGWYSNGPRPGEEGSAVINGHLDRPGGYPAIFWNLRYLQVGDNIMVVNAQGKIIHFRVLNIASYSPQAAPVQSIFGTMGGIYLNLITCAGTWIPSEHQTTQRLVAYTVMD